MSIKQTAETFWGRVNKAGDIDCWEWQGSKNSTGYGTVGWDGKLYTAHRVAAWLSNLVDTPSAPKRKSTRTYVLHKCDNRLCCNPNHFFLGNYSDNQLDAYGKKRRTQPKGERHSNAKLTSAQVKSIRSAYTKGAYQTDLAKKYGVSQTSISLIIRGATYK